MTIIYYSRIIYFRDKKAIIVYNMDMDKSSDKFNIAIIGGGPAGLTAALYACRAGKSAVIFERTYAGGAMLTTPKVDNYPAVPSISGWELSELMKKQAEEAGATVIAADIKSVINEDDIITVSDGTQSWQTDAIILAMGTARAKLRIDGEDRLSGRGVSWCATCDGMFYKDKDVAVIGGGYAAAEEAVYLSKICKKVYVINRGKSFKLNDVEMDKLNACENVEKIINAKTVSINGENQVRSITVDISGQVSNIEVSGVFIAVGSKPESPLLSLVALDSNGYIITDKNMLTSMPKVYAAGDIVSKPLRQIITACADGATAAESIVKALNAKNKA